MFKVPNGFRIRVGIMASTDDAGNNGAFIVRSIGFAHPLNVIASDGEGWEHVSVSLQHRTPTWEEMCFIKSKFWDEQDLVVQFHPPLSEYVNNHPYVLHLWRKAGTNDFCEMPPIKMV